MAFHTSRPLNSSLLDTRPKPDGTRGDPTGRLKKINNFGNKKKSKPKKQKIQDSSDDENEVCIVCLESFSRPREVWLQCWSCKSWAHKDCTDGRDFYTCHICDSD
ncbi:hypothetical protein N1851_010708 [Merluccius polli]|uniref:Zinc finger PHD-type domain-containing protein n=1 Tax=Merluccius polli TaxID=89951 RepID=A0AA47MZC0_MERPO|nr:hypothetical protein N1851_010708 [Merluccius polli]